MNNVVKIKANLFLLFLFLSSLIANAQAVVTISPSQSQGVKRLNPGNPQFFADNTGEVEFDRGSAAQYQTKYRRYEFSHPTFLNSAMTQVVLNLTYNKTTIAYYPNSPAIMDLRAVDITNNNAASWSSPSQTMIDAVQFGNSVFFQGIGTPNSGSTGSQTNSFLVNNLSFFVAGDNKFTLGFRPSQDGITITGISVTITYNTVPIGNNTITGGQAFVCSGTPSTLNGSTPTGGNGIYSYQWQYSNDNTTWLNIAGATTINHSPTAITQNRYYRRLVNSASQPQSTSNVIMVTVNPPAVPTGIIVYPTATNLTVSWNASSGATSYNIYDCTNNFVGTVNAPSTSFLVPGLNPSTTYSFKVKSVCSSNQSAYSNCASGTTSPLITNNIICCNQSYVGYQNNSPIVGGTPSGGTGIFTYSWEQSLDNVNWNLTGVTTAGYAPPALNATNYFRRIANSNSALNTSNVISITVSAPLTPLGLTAVAQTSTSILVSWNAASGATAYRIYNCANNALLATVSAPTTSFLHSNLTANTVYQYYVVAVCGTLASPASFCVSETTLPGALLNNTICCAQIYTGYQVSNMITGSLPTGGLGIGSYQYQWQTSQFSNTGYYAIIGATGQHYTSPPLTQTMYFRRLAVSGNQSTLSNRVPITVNPVPIPTNLTVASLSANSLLLNWNASTSATSYGIYNCSNNTLLYTVNAPTTNYLITGLTPSTTYNYYVVAFSGPMQSNISSCASGITTANPTGSDINTFGGNGSASYSGDGGNATAAAVLPAGNNGIAGMVNGNMFISDPASGVIRKIDSTGTIKKVAGTLNSNGYGGDNGLAKLALLNNPQGIAFDANNNMYIADKGNNRIRKITASTQIITTYGGIGTPGYAGDGGPAISAKINMPTALTTNQIGEVYFVDQGNFVIRKIDIAGKITTVVGNGTAGYSGDGGNALAASINNITGLVTKGQELYFSDNVNHVIRKVDFNTNVITTFAGNGSAGYSGDGGLATSGKINAPAGLGFDANGVLYISDHSNSVIRKVDQNGKIFTFAGTTQGFFGDNGLPINAKMANPGAMFINQNAIYFNDKLNNRIRIIYEYCYANAGHNVINLPGCCGGCQGVKIGSQALTGLIYSWTPNVNLSCVNCSQPIANDCNVSTPTNYLVAVKGVNCTIHQAAVQVSTINYTGPSCCRLGNTTFGSDLPFVENENFVVFPNPSNGQITIQLYNHADYIRVIDVNGKTIFSRDDVNNDEIRVDISEFPRGIYFLTVKIGKKLENRKIVVE